MRKAIAAIEKQADVAETLATLQAELLEGGFASVDYAELREAESLTRWPNWASARPGCWLQRGSARRG
jgi:hypothetical protein